jgi:hypothetical protein
VVEFVLIIWLFGVKHFDIDMMLFWKFKHERFYTITT